MGWRMKNFNILGVHGKIWVLEGGGFHEKPIYRGGCLKRGACTVCRFKVGGGGGWYPSTQYDYKIMLKNWEKDQSAKCIQETKRPVQNWHFKSNWNRPEPSKVSRQSSN